mgnify:CR=1 FL=1
MKERRYPFSLFLIGFITNILFHFFWLFVPSVILLFMGIWVDWCLFSGLALLGCDIIASFVEQMKIRQVMLSDSDDEQFRKFQDAVSKDGNVFENIRNLVENGMVSGWDDPRMPTLCGLRRRGYTPESIRAFHERNGVSKVNSVVDYAFLEYCLREDLNKNASRVMGVINPIKLIIDNYPEDQIEEFTVENNPEKPEDGTRTVSFSREVWIEAEDFMEVPEKKYFRLFPGNEVRLKSAYVVKCVGCDKDENGNITQVHCTYDTESRGGNTTDGRKVKSTIHWVDAKTALDAEIRLYDRLFTTESPDLADCNYLDFINPDSLKIVKGAKVEASLINAKPEDRFQFLRLGYFCADNKDFAADNLVFNRAVSLKDSYKPAT